MITLVKIISVAGTAPIIPNHVRYLSLPLRHISRGRGRGTYRLSDPLAHPSNRSRDAYTLDGRTGPPNGRIFSRATDDFSNSIRPTRHPVSKEGLGCFMRHSIWSNPQLSGYRTEHRQPPGISGCGYGKPPKPHDAFGALSPGNWCRWIFGWLCRWR